MLLGVLSWPDHPNIVGRIWLLTASLWLVVALIPCSVVSVLPLLVIRGWLGGRVLLCKHLSQRSRRIWGRGLSGLHWWCIVDLGG